MDKTLYSAIQDIEKNQGNINSSFSIMPWLIIIILGYIILVYLIKVEVHSLHNWNIDKCSPKYVFFSGFFKNNGKVKDPFKVTMNNFFDCINLANNNKLTQLNEFNY
jgi:hypothetical protein